MPNVEWQVVRSSTHGQPWASLHRQAEVSNLRRVAADEDVPRFDVTMDQFPGVKMNQPGHDVLQEPSARLRRQMSKAILLDLIVEIPTQKLHLDVPDALAD